MLSTKTNDWCRDVSSYLAAHFKTDMTLCKEYIKHCSSSNMKQVYNTNIKYHTTVYKHLCNTQTHTGAVQTSKHHVKRMKWTVIKNWKSIWHWTVKGQNQSAFLTTQDPGSSYIAPVHPLIHKHKVSSDTHSQAHQIKKIIILWRKVREKNKIMECKLWYEDVILSFKKSYLNV